MKVVTPLAKSAKGRSGEISNKEKTGPPPPSYIPEPPNSERELSADSRLRISDSTPPVSPTRSRAVTPIRKSRSPTDSPRGVLFNFES